MARFIGDRTDGTGLATLQPNLKREDARLLRALRGVEQLCEVVSRRALVSEAHRRSDSEFQSGVRVAVRN